MLKLQAWLVRWSFGLFIGWTMSFPYEGPLLYAFAANRQFDGVFYNSISVGLVAAGILSSAFLVRSWQMARRVMSWCVGISILGAGLIMILPSFLILPILMILAYVSGLFVSGWGYFHFHNTPALQRGKAIADVLIIGNLILTLSALLATWFDHWVGMAFNMVVLLIALKSCLKLHVEDTSALQEIPYDKNATPSFRKPFHVFLGFIFLISLTSGIMFQVVYPYFRGFELLSSLYPNIPYMLALFALRSMPQRINKNFTLFLGMSILGIAYCLYALMGEGILKFFLVMTPMLAAYGIFDYFWWRTMGDLCPYGKTPARIVGMSLFVNVFGVFFGGTVSLVVTKVFQLSSYQIAIFALGVTFVIIALLPLLNTHMRRLLSNHVFFEYYTALPAVEKAAVLEEPHFSEVLTAREMEIVQLILSGMTYVKIASALVISDNTVKTHAKNIYSKLGINSKYELIRLYQQK